MTVPERRLVSTQRIVAESGAEYEEAWEALRASATAAEARAWRFRAASDPAHFIEFLEFSGADDPRSRPELGQAIDRLEQIAPGEVQEWRDASHTPRKTLDDKGDR